MENRQLSEAFDIAQEECAEVISAISKIKRFGLSSEWNGTSNIEHLHNELGDLLAMIKVMYKLGIIDLDLLEQYTNKKMDKLKIWSSISV